MSIDFAALLALVIREARPDSAGIHGPAHWARVERNGLILARQPGVDESVVRLFALFHDSCRLNDGHDRDHGARGAEYARQLRGSAYTISDEQFARLHEACVWHTDGLHHADPTIGACWDADRLDLGRVGVIPEARFMSTALGRKIAEAGSIFPFLVAAERKE